MSDHQSKNPYAEFIFAMEDNASSRSAQATPRGAGATKSSAATGEQVRRKALHSRSSHPYTHTDPNPVETYAEAPTPASNWNAAFERPRTPPRFDSRNTRQNSPPQPNGVSSVHRAERFSHPVGSRYKPAPQHIFTGYDFDEDTGDSDMHNQYNSSSTTMNSTRPMIPSPLAPSPLAFLPLAPSPLSIVKQPQSKSMSTTREFFLVATVCLAHFLTQAGLAQSMAPLPFIESSFTTPTHAPSPSWYSAAYSLTVGTFILPSGRLGDLFGPKRIFIIGWLWFAVSSMGAGLYPRMRGNGEEQGDGDGGEIFFCFCRALQGIGPALLMPNGLAILGRTYEEGNRKNMAFALFGASAPVGFAIGSIMSSLLAEKANWCWAYWGLALACMVMAIVSVPVVPFLPGTAASSASFNNAKSLHDAEGGPPDTIPLWKRLDTPGSILGVTALILINVGVNQGALVGWSTAYTYFLLLLGLTLLVFFFFIEFHPSLTSYPLIPLSILSLDTCFVLACIACGWATFGIWMFYLWEFLERLRSLSPLVASAQLSPVIVSGVAAALSTGYLLSKTTPQVIMLLAMCAFFVGTTLLATAPVDQIYWAQAFLSIVIMPWGMDMSFPSATILLSGKVGPENQGVAMSLVNTVVNYSISIGLGLAGTVQSQVDKDGTQQLSGYRSAWYFGMGLSATGVLVALAFVAMGAWKARRSSGWRWGKGGVGDA